jgi:hypothetical protein
MILCAKKRRVQTAKFANDSRASSKRADRQSGTSLRPSGMHRQQPREHGGAMLRIENLQEDTMVHVTALPFEEQAILFSPSRCSLFVPSLSLSPLGIRLLGLD